MSPAQPVGPRWRGSGPTPYRLRDPIGHTSSDTLTPSLKVPKTYWYRCGAAALLRSYLSVKQRQFRARLGRYAVVGRAVVIVPVEEQVRVARFQIIPRRAPGGAWLQSHLGRPGSDRGSLDSFPRGIYLGMDLPGRRKTYEMARLLWHQSVRLGRRGGGPLPAGDLRHPPGRRSARLAISRHCLRGATTTSICGPTTP